MNNENMEIDPISCKVVLVGPSTVGKTSIINRYSSDIFAEKMMVTTGASYATKTLFMENEQKYIKFEIWDTIGQERYRSLSRMFYKEANIAILVYDITQRSTFAELKSVWLNEIKENAGADVILGLAANKNDLYEREQIDQNEGKELAHEIGAIFQLTSAKNAFGLADLFKKLGSKFLNPEANFSHNTTVVKPNKNSIILQPKDGNQGKQVKKCC